MKVAIVALAGCLAMPILAGEWTGWRGPSRDGRIPGLEAPAEWPSQLERRWTVEVGEGHSSPVVATGRVFQLSREEDREIVRALEIDSGEQLWRQSYEVDFKPGMGSGRHGKGPNSTPAVAAGRLFTMSVSGILTAWDTATGEVLWQREPPGAGPGAPKYGASASPLATDDLLVVHLGGGKDGRLASLDPASGEELWSWKGDGPAYASPILVELDGVQQVVTQANQAIVAVAAESGELLWEIPFKQSLANQNAVTPVAHDDGLVILSGRKRGTWAVRPRREGDSWRIENVWRNDDLPMALSSPVVEGNRVFGLSHLRKGQLFALDAATGKALWTSEGRTAENAALLTAPGIVLALTTDAKLIVLDAHAGEERRLATYEVADSETWAHPAIVGRRILVKDAHSLTLWSY